MVIDKADSCPISCLRVHGKYKTSVCITLRFDGLLKSELDVIWQEIRLASSKKGFEYTEGRSSNSVKYIEYD